MSLSTINTGLDFVLIAAAVWMVIVVRGLGGVIGKGLNWITVGTVVLGIAHLLDTLMRQFGLGWDAPTFSFAHRIIVLVGFVVLIVGFQQIQSIKK
jgi:hypothetical protein